MPVILALRSNRKQMSYIPSFDGCSRTSPIFVCREETYGVEESRNSADPSCDFMLMCTVRERKYSNEANKHSRVSSMRMMEKTIA